MLKNNSVTKIDSNGKKVVIGIDSEGKIGVISSKKPKKKKRKVSKNK